MLNMSFHHGTLNKEELIDFINKTDKPIKYNYGFKYRNPRTYEVPITKEMAIQIVKTESLLDAIEHKDYLDLNAYSGNDMW